MRGISLSGMRPATVPPSLDRTDRKLAANYRSSCRRPSLANDVIDCRPRIARTISSSFSCPAIHVRDLEQYYVQGRRIKSRQHRQSKLDLQSYFVRRVTAWLRC